MNNLIQQYFEIILLIYGFSCLILSTVIYVLPKDDLQSSLLRNLPLIALFGILHSGHIGIDWWLYRYAISSPLLHLINIGLTLASYLPLLEFGRRVFYSRGYLILASKLPVYSFIGSAMLTMTAFDSTAANGLIVSSRLLIGFPGTVITGLAILNANSEPYRELKYYLRIAGCCFLVYSLSVVVLPDSDSDFQQIFLSRAEFLARFGIPIQLLQTFSILVVSILLTHLVRRINFYSRQAELTAIAEVSGFNSKLEYRVQQKTEELKQLARQLRRDIAERQKIEAQLRLSEERWKFALEGAGDGMWDYNLQTHEVFYSRRYKEMYGLVEDENGKLNYKWQNCVHPDDMPGLLKKLKDYLDGKSPSFATEYRMRGNDGSWKWILDRGMLISRTEDGKPLRMIGTHSDITERRKIEIEKEQFFKFFNFARDLQCIASTDGFFRQVNPAFTETLGFSKQELLETPFIEFVVPEDRQRTMQEMEKELENKLDIEGSNDYFYVTIDFENRYFCKDGSVRWLSWKAIFNPADALIYATARDVTESKKIAEKLQLAEMVYQNSIEAILVTDEQNQIIAVNPAFTKITGYSLEEVSGKNPRIFKSYRHNQDFYTNMWEEIRTEGHWQGEIWDRRKNGELYAKFLNINTILDKDKKIHRYLALFSDVTARKQYEEEIQRLSDSQLNKAKLEAEKANLAKSEFLSSMSHELRTPMNAVLGFAQLLESENLTEDQLDSVKEILTAGHHLMNLINEVLDLSKIEADKLEVCLEKIDLNDLLQTCLNLIQPLAVRNEIKIVDNCSANCKFYVRADKLRLKQVLLNLISNAIKYNRPDGSVSLSCTVISPESLRINVADSGNGLSEAQLAKLFQPFERLNAKNSNIEGTGIGLMITKKLVEAMRGSIGVSSKIGEGSCFWIDIPLA